MEDINLWRSQAHKNLYTALYMWTSDVAREWVRRTAKPRWGSSKVERKFTAMFMTESSERKLQALRDVQDAKVKQGRDEPLANYIIRFKSKLTEANIAHKKDYSAMTCYCFAKGLIEPLRKQANCDKDGRFFTNLHRLIKHITAKDKTHRLGREVAQDEKVARVAAAITSSDRKRSQDAAGVAQTTHYPNKRPNRGSFVQDSSRGRLPKEIEFYTNPSDRYLDPRQAPNFHVAAVRVPNEAYRHQDIYAPRHPQWGDRNAGAGGRYAGGRNAGGRNAGGRYNGRGGRGQGGRNGGRNGGRHPGYRPRPDIRNDHQGGNAGQSLKDRVCQEVQNNWGRYEHTRLQSDLYRQAQGNPRRYFNLMMEANNRARVHRCFLCDQHHETEEHLR